jgi:hypothetical protein
VVGSAREAAQIIEEQSKSNIESWWQTPLLKYLFDVWKAYSYDFT